MKKNEFFINFNNLLSKYYLTYYLSITQHIPVASILCVPMPTIINYDLQNVYNLLLIRVKRYYLSTIIL